MSGKWKLNITWWIFDLSFCIMGIHSWQTLWDDDSVKYCSTNSKLGFFSQADKSSISNTQSIISFNSDAHGFIHEKPHQRKVKSRQWASWLIFKSIHRNKCRYLRITGRPINRNKSATVVWLVERTWDCPASEMWWEVG